MSMVANVPDTGSTFDDFSSLPHSSRLQSAKEISSASTAEVPLTSPLKPPSHSALYPAFYASDDGEKESAPLAEGGRSVETPAHESRLAEMRRELQEIREMSHPAPISGGLSSHHRPSSPLSMEKKAQQTLPYFMEHRPKEEEVVREGRKKKESTSMPEAEAEEEGGVASTRPSSSVQAVPPAPFHASPPPSSSSIIMASTTSSSSDGHALSPYTPPRYGAGQVRKDTAVMAGSGDDPSAKSYENAWRTSSPLPYASAEDLEPPPSHMVYQRTLEPLTGSFASPLSSGEGKPPPSGTTADGTLPVRSKAGPEKRGGWKEAEGGLSDEDERDRNPKKGPTAPPKNNHHKKKIIPPEGFSPTSPIAFQGDHSPSSEAGREKRKGTPLLSSPFSFPSSCAGVEATKSTPPTTAKKSRRPKEGEEDEDALGRGETKKNPLVRGMRKGRAAVAEHPPNAVIRTTLAPLAAPVHLTSLHTHPSPSSMGPRRRDEWAGNGSTDASDVEYHRHPKAKERARRRRAEMREVLQESRQTHDTQRVMELGKGGEGGGYASPAGVSRSADSWRGAGAAGPSTFSSPASVSLSGVPLPAGSPPFSTDGEGGGATSPSLTCASASSNPLSSPLTVLRQTHGERKRERLQNPQQADFSKSLWIHSPSPHLLLSSPSRPPFDWTRESGDDWRRNGGGGGGGAEGGGGSGWKYGFASPYLGRQGTSLMRFPFTVDPLPSSSTLVTTPSQPAPEPVPFFLGRGTIGIEERLHPELYQHNPPLSLMQWAFLYSRRAMEEREMKRQAAYHAWREAALSHTPFANAERMEPSWQEESRDTSTGEKEDTGREEEHHDDDEPDVSGSESAGGKSLLVSRKWMKSILQFNGDKGKYNNTKRKTIVAISSPAIPVGEKPPHPAGEATSAVDPAAAPPPPYTVTVRKRLQRERRRRDAAAERERQEHAEKVLQDHRRWRSGEAVHLPSAYYHSAHKRLHSMQVPGAPLHPNDIRVQHHHLAQQLTQAQIHADRAALEEDRRQEGLLQRQSMAEATSSSREAIAQYNRSLRDWDKTITASRAAWKPSSAPAEKDGKPGPPPLPFSASSEEEDDEEAEAYGLASLSHRAKKAGKPRAALSPTTATARPSLRPSKAAEAAVVPTASSSPPPPLRSTTPKMASCPPSRPTSRGAYLHRVGAPGGSTIQPGPTTTHLVDEIELWKRTFAPPPHPGSSGGCTEDGSGGKAYDGSDPLQRREWLGQLEKDRLAFNLKTAEREREAKREVLLSRERWFEGNAQKAEKEREEQLHHALEREKANQATLAMRERAYAIQRHQSEIA